MRFSRLILTIAVIGATVIATAGEGPTPKVKGAIQQPNAAGLQLLQGKWEGGVVGDKATNNIIVTVTGDSFHFHRDTNFWFETTITLPAGTEPKQLHATIKACAAGQEDSVGKVVVAIYKIENATLTLVAGGGGVDEAPKNFETDGDKGLTRYELRKVQPQKKDAQPRRSK